MAKQTITYDPQVLDLILYAGDGVNFRLVVTDSVGAPIDITGVMKAHIRQDRSSAGMPIATFVINLDNAIVGIAVLSLTGAVTQSLAPEDVKFTGVWDLEWTGTGKQPVTLCQGKVECAPDVSS